MKVVDMPIQKKLVAVVMRLWTRRVRMPWTAKKKYVEVMEGAGQTRSLFRQTGFIGHIMRTESLNH